MVVEICHAVGVSVESMVRKIHLAFGDEGEFIQDTIEDEELTDPDRAVEFVNNTGVDALVISVGTEPGSYLTGKQPEIVSPLLAEISNCVDSVPLVVNGGSAIPDNDLRKMKAFPVAKLNIGSMLRATFRDSLFNSIHENPHIDMREALKKAEKATQKVVLEKIRLLSSSA